MESLFFGSLTSLEISSFSLTRQNTFSLLLAPCSQFEKIGSVPRHNQTVHEGGAGSHGPVGETRPRSFQGTIKTDSREDKIARAEGFGLLEDYFFYFMDVPSLLHLVCNRARCLFCFRTASKASCHRCVALSLQRRHLLKAEALGFEDLPLAIPGQNRENTSDRPVEMEHRKAVAKKRKSPYIQERS